MAAKPYYRLLIPVYELQPHCTLDEVAKEIGTSRERARQIEARALRKLRRALAERGYRVEDLLDTGGQHGRTSSMSSFPGVVLIPVAPPGSPSRRTEERL